MATVLIGGDSAPMNRCEPLFRAGDAEGLFGDLLEHFEAADFSILNLECPFVEQPAPIDKCGQVFGCDPACVKGFSAAGVSALNLANNHIRDNGWQGVDSTIKTCRAAGIEPTGAGENIERASRILVCEVAGVRIGVLSAAEHSFGVAGPHCWGAAPLDPISMVRALKRAEGTYDFLIALIHGGNEYLPTPSLRLMDMCRFLVEQGAGVVCCQHSHQVGCTEDYKGGLIVYGQGNFLFDRGGQAKNGEDWNRALLVRLEVEADGRATHRLIPVRQNDDRIGARSMPEQEAAQFMQDLTRRSEAIGDPAFVAAEWRRFSHAKADAYLARLHGDGDVGRALNRLTRWLRLKYVGQARLRALHTLRCEAHRDLAMAALWRDEPDPDEG